MNLRKWMLILIMSFNECFCVFQKFTKLSEPFDVLSGVHGRDQCVKECLLRRRCNCVGYNMDLLRCDLGETKNVTSDLNSKAMTANREDLSEFQGELGKCSDISCNVGEKCFELTSGNPVCLASDCDQPPLVENSKPNSRFSSIGAVVNYTCDAGYTLWGSSSKITCRPNGQWSSRQFGCQNVCPVSSGYVYEVLQVNDVQKTLCYRINNVPNFYINAKYECGISGGHLIRFQEQWKLDEIKSLIDTGGTYHVDGELSKGKWIYSDGSNFSIISGLSYMLTNGGSNVKFIEGEGFRDTSELFIARSICEV